ncbi:sulfur carrier protein ThiS [Pannonibacter phragmitetus]|uniref:sulfur carrier protein ThiS n=1 Tax=Pannonibacter phragmitetus TaxID=121719 RepID=UPI000B96CC75|nr:sulfur carrier protein ThiS [Pannonibacter phragmitetus]MBA4204949.1 thiamine biosynthesis protein ThiS [Polymorphum sp.]
MNVLVNGEAVACAAETLPALLQELDYEGDWLATAVNGELVPREARDACRLNEGDRIEILSPMQGG